MIFQNIIDKFKGVERDIGVSKESININNFDKGDVIADKETFKVYVVISKDDTTVTCINIGILFMDKNQKICINYNSNANNGIVTIDDFSQFIKDYILNNFIILDMKYKIDELYFIRINQV